MKTINSTVALIVLGLILCNCSKEEQIQMTPSPTQENPESDGPEGDGQQANEESKVNEVFPQEGPVGTIVTIRGQGLAGATEVYFNNLKSEAIQVGGENEIIAEVPFRANTGAIKILFGEKELMGPEFTYISTNRVTTLAGSSLGNADGKGEEAEFNHPRGIVIAEDGSLLVTDSNHTIRSITLEGYVNKVAGQESDFADGYLMEARFNNPGGLVYDHFGNLFLADIYNHKIRKISLTGLVSTWSGSIKGDSDGFGSAKFNTPWNLTIDAENNLYVTDAQNHRIRKISATGQVTTIAGSVEGFKDGVGGEVQFNLPADVVVDDEFTIYVADARNNRIRKISPNGEVSTFAGGESGHKDGTVSEAQFAFPMGLEIDSVGNIYVADHSNNRIRKITPDGLVSTIAGGDQGSLDGAGTQAQFNGPSDLVLDEENQILYITDYNNHRIRKIELD